MRKPFSFNALVLTSPTVSGSVDGVDGDAYDGVAGPAYAGVGGACYADAGRGKNACPASKFR